MPVRLNSFILAIGLLLLVILPMDARADSLRITPSKVVLPLGGAQRLELHDASGAAVAGAEWSLSVSDVVVSLSTVPKVTIAAVAPGEVTVTAVFAGQTAEATVTVIGAAELPPDTPLWHVSPARPEDGPSALVSAQNDDGTGADYFLVEGSGSSPVVRGVRLDGTEVWRRPFGSGPFASGLYVGPILADASGGVILSTWGYVLPSTLLRLDGHTGAITWQHSRNGYFDTAALQPSGRVVVRASVGPNVYLLGIDAATGNVVFDTAVPTSDYGYGEIYPDVVGELTVGADGKVYAVRLHVAQGLVGCQFTHDEWLDLVSVEDNGSLASVTGLNEYHSSMDACAAYPVYDSAMPGQVFPGAAGGLTVTWFKMQVGDSTYRQMITTLNGGRSDVEASSLVLAVGSDGSGYGHRFSDGVLASVDTVSGGPKWAATEGGTIAAVLADQSLLVLNPWGSR